MKEVSMNVQFRIKLFCFLMTLTLLTSTSPCFANRRFTNFTELAKELSGKIVLESSCNIIIVDLDSEEVFYLAYDRIKALKPQWGPSFDTITYIEPKSTTYIDYVYEGPPNAIKIIGLNDVSRIFVPGIYPSEFAWSHDKKLFAYIEEQGQLTILTDRGKESLSINLLTKFPKNFYTYSPIFSKDNKNIFFVSHTNDKKVPCSTAICEFNIEAQTVKPIKEMNDTIHSISISPEGDRLVYTSDTGLYLFDIEKKSEEKLTKLPALLDNFCCWSPDGTKVLYGYPRPLTGYLAFKSPILDVYMLDITTKEKTLLLDKSILRKEINFKELFFRSVDWSN